MRDDRPLRVESPVGGVESIYQVCHECVLTIGDVELSFDLYVMPMRTFSLILEMDWLMAFQAKIDCYRRRVSFISPTGSSCTLVGEWDKNAGRAGPTRELWGNITHRLATLTFEEEGNLEKRVWPDVAENFQDVFHGELLELPPKRSIEFTIELLPAVGPISQVAYRMGPAELREL